MNAAEENVVRQFHLYVVKTLINSGIVTNPTQIISLQNLVNQYIADQEKPELLTERIQKAIAHDQQEMSKALSEYKNLAPEECCPHSSAESQYIGEGDTQHTCRCCHYYWITSNQKYHE